MGKQTIVIGTVQLIGSEKALEGFLKAAKLTNQRLESGGTFWENLTGICLFAEHNEITGADGVRYFTNLASGSKSKVKVTCRRLPVKKAPKWEQPDEFIIDG